MFKKIEIWILYFLLVIFLIVLILFGGILRHHYLGGEKFKLIQMTAKFIAEVPYNIKRIVLLLDDQGRYFLDESQKFKEKPKSKIYNDERIDGLLLLSRYDGDKDKFIVEVVDLLNYKTIHTYTPNSKELINSVNIQDNYKKFDDLKKNLSYQRLFTWHPFLDGNGDVIFNSASPLFKINFCSNLVWTNDEHSYHHSIEKGNEGNYWVPSILIPSMIDDEYYKNYEGDEGISKISPEGQLIFEKSVTQILIDNGYRHLLFSQFTYSSDIIHMNDIQPVLEDSKFWKKGDLFLSLRNLSMIILYRPSTNKIIKMLRSPFFSYQHDVDIIDNKTIHIFNNNLFNTKKGQKVFTNSEIISYDFELDEYSKVYNKTLKKHDVETAFGGLYQKLNNGSFMIEEQEHGRLLIFNNKQEIIWEFVNKSRDDKIYALRWSRIIENKEIIKSFKELIKEKKCTN